MLNTVCLHRNTFPVRHNYMVLKFKHFVSKDKTFERNIEFESNFNFKKICFNSFVLKTKLGNAQYA